MINLQSFPEFELQPKDTTPIHFEKYIKHLNTMFTVMNITWASQKKAMLLHYVGEETCDVFETLTIPEPTVGSDEYKTAIKALLITSNLRNVLITKSMSFIRKHKGQVKILPSSTHVFSC